MQQPYPHPHESTSSSYAQPQPQQVVIVQQQQVQVENNCCAGFTGCFLTWFFSPLIALCGLCCFKTLKARSSLFLGGGIMALIGCVGFFILFGYYNYLSAAVSDAAKNNNTVTSTGWYYKDPSGKYNACVLNNSGNCKLFC